MTFPSDDAAILKAELYNIRLDKRRNVVQIIFERDVDSFESERGYEVLGGMSCAAKGGWFAIARLNNVKGTASSESPTVGQGGEVIAQPRPPLTLAQQVAMLRKNQLYRSYMEAKDEEDCKSIQCAQWGVSSVSHVPDHELNDHLNAFAAWKLCV